MTPFIHVIIIMIYLQPLCGLGFFYNCTIFISQRMAIFEVNLLSIVLSSSAGVGPARHLRLSHDLSVASSHSPWVLHPVCCCPASSLLALVHIQYPCCCSFGVSSGFIHLIPLLLTLTPHFFYLVPYPSFLLPNP